MQQFYKSKTGRELTNSFECYDNQWYGTQQFPESLKLETQVGAFAQKLTITDKMMRTQGRLGVKFMYNNPKTGKDMIVEKFYPYAEHMMYEELYTNMEALIIIWVSM